MSDTKMTRANAMSVAVDALGYVLENDTDYLSADAEAEYGQAYAVLTAAPTNEERADHGFEAVRAGDPDYDGTDDRSSLVDTLTNILHWASAQGLDVRDALTSAENHYSAERAS